MLAFFCLLGMGIGSSIGSELSGRLWPNQDNGLKKDFTLIMPLPSLSDLVILLDDSEDPRRKAVALTLAGALVGLVVAGGVGWLVL